MHPLWCIVQGAKEFPLSRRAKYRYSLCIPFYQLLKIDVLTIMRAAQTLCILDRLSQTQCHQQYTNCEKKHTTPHNAHLYVICPQNDEVVMIRKGPWLSQN
jgi:gamma-glutamylcyclotransferase (GGCT)/AIG2-like uncharacterized protein YtfP